MLILMNYFTVSTASKMVITAKRQNQQTELSHSAKEKLGLPRNKGISMFRCQFNLIKGNQTS